MEAVGDSKEEPAPLGPVAHRNMVSKSRSQERDGGGLVKRKRVLSDLDHRQKRSCGVGVQSPAGSLSVKTKSVKDAATGKASDGKRKRARAPEESEPELDADQAFSAAQALYELFGGGLRSKRTPELRIDAVQWAGKKSRSSRSKKEDDCGYKLSSSSSTSVSEVPEVLDSPTSHKHRMESPQAVLDTVNREEEAESESEGRSTGESPDKGSEEHNLVSQSSLESTLVNSRAESPSSPLPFARTDEVLVPKLEEEVIARFGFHRALPMRPIKKPSMLRKPKVEEKSSESDDLKLLKVVPKQVSRRKPRASKSDGQSISLKVETTDFQAVSATSSLLRESFEENKCQTRPTEPATLNLFDIVKAEIEVVKMESRPLQKMGSSTQGRLKTALSEAEKEVRRLRRVQANRESARQTIRRKQVLCEELAHTAADLLTEKEDLTQKMELATSELRTQLKMNQHLKEQLALQAGNNEALFASTNPDNLEIAMPMNGGLSLPPYWWAFALAQAAAAGQSMTLQANEGTLGPDCNPMVAAAATMAAAINSGMGMNPNLWLAINSSLATINLFTEKVPASGQQPTFSMAPARLATTAESPSVSPRKLDVLMAVEPDRNVMLGNSYMDQNQGEMRSSYLCAEGVAKPEAHSIVSRLQSSGKAQVAGLTSVSQSTEKRHMPGLTSISHSSLPNSLPLSGMMMHSTLGPEGPGASSTLSFSTTSDRPNSARLSHSGTFGNQGYYPSFQSGGQGYLGVNPGLVRAQSATAALATQARRRRRELKRTKSLQSRQGQRLAKTRTL